MAIRPNARYKHRCVRTLVGVRACGVLLCACVCARGCLLDCVQACVRASMWALMRA